MNLAANLVTAFVALSHLGFLVLEMFFWNHPVGWRIFAMAPEAAASSAVLAANQGLYNGFLAAGLFWGLSLGESGFGVKIFFLLCVLIAMVTQVIISVGNEYAEYYASPELRQILFSCGSVLP